MQALQLLAHILIQFSNLNNKVYIIFDSVFLHDRILWHYFISYKAAGLYFYSLYTVENKLREKKGS